MQVTFFYRRPTKDNFSIEKVFDTVREHLPDDIKDTVFKPKYVSKGIWPRIYNIIESAFHQGDINHITGDVNYLGLLMKKKRTVLTILDCVFLQSKMSKFSKSIIALLWYRLPMRRAECITTISKSSKNDILSFVRCDPKKILVISVPLSSEFSYLPKAFNATNPIILQIGATPNKNLGNLFRAINGIKCHLCIVGHLSNKQLTELQNNKIKFTNFTNLTSQQITERYKECDMVTFVSTYEGFGMPIIEANATGRPVVTSNIPPMTDVAGSSACLVNPYSVEEIRKGITKIIGNENYRQQLIAKGLKNALRFDPKVIANQYARIYRSLSQTNKSNTRTHK